MSFIFRVTSMNQRLKSCFKFSIGKNVLKLPVECNCKFAATPTSTLIRNYETDSSIKSSPRVQIYTGKLTKQIRNIKILSLFTTAMGLGVQPYVYIKSLSAGTTIPYIIPIFSVVGAFVISTPILLHWIMKRYIIQLDYVPKIDKYIATTYSFFARKVETEFSPSDVTQPLVERAMSNIMINGKPVFLDFKNFRLKDKKHLKRILGFDKPVDLKIGLEDEIRATRIETIKANPLGTIKEAATDEIKESSDEQLKKLKN